MKKNRFSIQLLYAFAIVSCLSCSAVLGQETNNRVFIPSNSQVATLVPVKKGDSFTIRTQVLPHKRHLFAGVLGALGLAAATYQTQQSSPTSKFHTISNRPYLLQGIGLGLGAIAIEIFDSKKHAKTGLRYSLYSIDTMVVASNITTKQRKGELLLQGKVPEDGFLQVSAINKKGETQGDVTLSIAKATGNGGSMPNMSYTPPDEVGDPGFTGFGGGFNYFMGGGIDWRSFGGSGGGGGGIPDNGHPIGGGSTPNTLQMSDINNYRNESQIITDMENSVGINDGNRQNYVSLTNGITYTNASISTPFKIHINQNRTPLQGMLAYAHELNNAKHIAELKAIWAAPSNQPNTPANKTTFADALANIEAEGIYQQMLLVYEQKAEEYLSADKQPLYDAALDALEGIITKQQALTKIFNYIKSGQAKDEAGNSIYQGYLDQYDQFANQ